jgi:hypothetical protein
LFLENELNCGIFKLASVMNHVIKLYLFTVNGGEKEEKRTRKE